MGGSKLYVQPFKYKWVTKHTIEILAQNCLFAYRNVVALPYKAGVPADVHRKKTAINPRFFLIDFPLRSYFDSVTTNELHCVVSFCFLIFRNQCAILLFQFKSASSCD